MKLEFIASPEQIRPSLALQVLLPRAGGPWPQQHLEACAKAVKQTGAIVCTAPFESNGRVAMAYIGPEGPVLQSACFLPAEPAGYTAGEDVTVFNTQFGALAMACGVDSLQPQYARAAALKGCQLLVCGLWQPGREYLLAGPWSGAQANCMAVAVAQPQEGQLLLPCTLTPDKSGFGRAKFEPQELAEAYKDFPVFDCMDASLYARYKEELLQ